MREWPRDWQKAALKAVLKELQKVVLKELQKVVQRGLPREREKSNWR